MKKKLLICLFLVFAIIYSKSAIGDDTKVYIMDNGTIECDANWMVAGTVVGTRKMKHPRTKWIKVPTYAVLIDHPEAKILFDLGTHPDANSINSKIVLDGWTLADIFPYYYEESQRFEKQLALAGVKPKDISTVVLSHLHFDHSGNLHLFDHADIYLHPSELEANPHISIKKPRLVKEDFGLLPGVEVITLPGHTAGLLGIVVHLREEGTLIFTSDAIYTSTNYGPPVKASGVVYDSLSYYKSIEKVRGLEKKHKAKVMFGHDMEFFRTMKKAPEYYE